MMWETEVVRKNLVLVPLSTTNTIWATLATNTSLHSEKQITSYGVARKSTLRASQLRVLRLFRYKWHEVTEYAEVVTTIMIFTRHKILLRWWRIRWIGQATGIEWDAEWIHKCSNRTLNKWKSRCRILYENIKTGLGEILCEGRD
jgi:hypothetical protein